ncbi:MAG: response regulator [Rhodospirillales bacterium]|jgi:DNA-binding response OmpR family regulator|nr:response regulator [Rhodospirillales bacterium]
MALKVFIVDDDETIIEFMSLMLETAGYDVSSSMAGAEALPQIVAQKPDCILTDLMMAELDGLQLCQEIRGRSLSPNPVVIVVSARDHPYWMERAREAGADGYLTKPLAVETFVEKIEAIMTDTKRT